MQCVTKRGASNVKARGKGQLKCDGTRTETGFSLSAKRTSPFNSAGASVQSTTGSRGVRISGSNAGCTMFRGSVKGTGYPLHSKVSPSLPLPCVTVCHHISTGLYSLSLKGCHYKPLRLIHSDTVCTFQTKSVQNRSFIFYPILTFGIIVLEVS
jgi:hypothetical protein